MSALRASCCAVSAALLLSACAGIGTRGADDRVYPVAAMFDATLLLPPPPTDEVARRDLAAVHAAQQARTPEQAAGAEASIAVDPFLFGAVLGSRFTAEREPMTAGFLQRVYRSALPYLTATKNCWNRPRPFVVDPTLAPLERSLASTKLRSAPAPVPKGSHPPKVDSPCTAPAADTSYAPSYPSGHALVGAMFAIVLATMVPERREALFAYGWGYGEARVTSGVHFPSDVEAGRILGTTLIGMMQQDARFRRDLGAARQELRKALGYQ